MQSRTDAGSTNVGDIEHEGWLTSVTSIEGLWRLRSHWFYAAGGAVPAGLDIEFVSVPERFRQEGKNTWFDAGTPTPQPVTRAAVEALSLGRILREHREQAWASMRAEAEEGSSGGGFYACAAGQADAIAAPHRDRQSPADDHFRRAADLYLRAPGPHRSRWVAEQMWATGYTFRRKGEDVSPTADRVRQWIAEARKRGYLPPAERKERR